MIEMRSKRADHQTLQLFLKVMHFIKGGKIIKTAWMFLLIYCLVNHNFTIFYQFLSVFLKQRFKNYTECRISMSKQEQHNNIQLIPLLDKPFIKSLCIYFTHFFLFPGPPSSLVVVVVVQFLGYKIIS